jgi:hypothetical protein
MTNTTNDWQQAFQAFRDHHETDIEGFLVRWFSSTSALDFVIDHHHELKSVDLFERALLFAWIHAKTNVRNWSRGFTRGIFEGLCDRGRLFAAGDPLPGTGCFTIYRGIAGTGAARRIRGISWTALPERARWFAAWYAGRFKLPNPSVYRTVVEQKDMLAYSNARGEQEFLVLLTSNHKIQVVERLSDAAVSEHLRSEAQTPNVAT